MITLVVVFVVALFFLKTKSTFTNQAQNGESTEGLSYDTTILKDLVNQDTDGDGIVDWEEGLWATNPNKKDTDDDGVSDSVEIAKIKAESGQNNVEIVRSEENLTQTDKFSREFFSTVAALNQSGEMDQATVDKLGASLAMQIENSPQEKIFKLSELQIINDSSVGAIQKYDNEIRAVYSKYPIVGSPVNIFKESITEDEDIDGSVLEKLDPIVQQTKKIISGMVQIKVPQKLASSHLELLNTLERITENLSNVQMLDADPIVAFSAMSQYEENATMLESAGNNLENAIDEILSN